MDLQVPLKTWTQIKGSSYILTFCQRSGQLSFFCSIAHLHFPHLQAYTPLQTVYLVSIHPHFVMILYYFGHQWRLYNFFLQAEHLYQKLVRKMEGKLLKIQIDPNMRLMHITFTHLIDFQRAHLRQTSLPGKDHLENWLSGCHN